ncbi:ABC transporter ATP-binding protein [Evansella sp. AB-P1]|uniref:ABC transporter ATP-binding protein n=1 Tax=Evansella sp. AB-P1 TaxID=3037653 RepID=UPI00241FF311|nr:ABC transporter ATP-binding protein [Evansella sp. AB-P1]MDG5787051.1 ABC transporter ATP-binding protein [Evansella sp. AB-P1]
MNNLILSLNDVSKRFINQDALSRVDLKLEQPGIVGLIGPNGSGKSTLLKLMAGLVQPSAGQVLLSDKKITRRSGNQIAFLAEIDSLYSFQTVEEAIHFYKGTTPYFSKEKAIEMADILKLDHKKKIKSLSKGNRARLKIVLTLARNAPILLMDEPLSGLDPLVREDILKMIVSYVDVEKQMVVLSTHEVAEVEPFLDYVIFLKDGKILLKDNVDSLREKRNTSLVESMKEVLA